MTFKATYALVSTGCQNGVTAHQFQASTWRQAIVEAEKLQGDGPGEGDTCTLIKLEREE